METEHLDLNRAMWDSRAGAHARSPEYEVERFLANPDHLSAVVRFDRPRLGDIAGLRAVHLQCHIGTDTLSLHRLGARVTGLDLSPESLAQARQLASATDAGIDYIEADVHDALTVLDPGSFDLVYTGIGAICWLPDLDAWASVVAGLLRPGGRLLIRDMHPMLGTLDVIDGAVAMGYPYFNSGEPLVITDSETYVPTDEHLAEHTSVEWPHHLGETITALLNAGLQLTGLTEHDSVPWLALPGHMQPHPDHAGEWRLSEHPERLAASFTLTAQRPVSPD